MLTTLMFALSLVSWLSVDEAMEQQPGIRTGDRGGAGQDLDERKPPQFT